jgi:hypothetical protein
MIHVTRNHRFPLHLSTRPKHVRLTANVNLRTTVADRERVVAELFFLLPPNLPPDRSTCYLHRIIWTIRDFVSYLDSDPWLRRRDLRLPLFLVVVFLRLICLTQIAF